MFDQLKDALIEEFQSDIDRLKSEDLRARLKDVLVRTSEYATLTLVTGQHDRHRDNLLQLYSIAASITATEASRVEMRVQRTAVKAVTSVVSIALKV